MNSINSFRLIKETASTTIEIFRKSTTDAKIRTAVDFLMQVWPKGWALYLTYTAIRCAGIAYKLRDAPDAQSAKKTWEEAQVYINTKVLGIAASQVALVALGTTTLISVALVLLWGVVLSSVSTYAHVRSKN